MGPFRPIWSGGNQEMLRDPGCTTVTVIFLGGKLGTMGTGINDITTKVEYKYHLPSVYVLTDTSSLSPLIIPLPLIALTVIA